MKINTILITISAVLLLLIAGCAAPMCYPPSKVIGNKCCVDNNDNNVCDFDEEEETEEPKAETEEPEEAQPEEPVELSEPEVEEPQIQRVKMPEPAPTEEEELQFGKMKMKTGEPHKYLTLDEITAYRTSNDKGMFDEMIFTVRNIGGTPLNPTVELYFSNEGMDFSETERVYEYPLKVMKEYKLETLKPGEKHVIKQSLGIRFQGIEQSKRLELSVYDRYASPRKNLETVKDDIVPVDIFPDMEIHTFGRED